MRTKTVRIKEPTGEYKNYVPIQTNLFDRLFHRRKLFVVDFMHKGEYLLDKYFARHQVVIAYPDGNGSYTHAQYRHVHMYPIVYKMKDEQKVLDALQDMRNQIPFFDKDGEYERAISYFFNEIERGLQEARQTQRK